MTHLIKIMYVIGQLTTGGTERQLLELVKHIDRTHFDVCVVSLSNDASLKPEFQRAGCDVYLLDRNRQGRFLAFLQLCSIVKTYRSHIIHAFSYASRAAILAAQTIGGIKTIASFRTDPSRQIRWFDKPIYSFADTLLSNSKAADEKVKQLWPGLKRAMIYNGLDLSEFDSNAVSKTDAQNLDIQERENSARICVVARLAPVKGLDILLEAFAQVHVAFPDVQLWVVGSGPLRRALEEQVEKSGLGSAVVFLGERRDVSAVLAHCHLAVLSSHAEGLPNAILEYMAACLPVVVTNVGGNAELVVDGETGLIVPPNDPQSLAKALLYFLRNPENASRMGETGRKRVEAYFTVERMVTETENLYLSLLQGKYVP